MVMKLEPKLQVTNNDKKLKNYHQRRILKLIIILLALGVIVLEILALLGKVSMFWGIGLFVIIQILIKIY